MAAVQRFLPEVDILNQLVQDAHRHQLALLLNTPGHWTSERKPTDTLIHDKPSNDMLRF